MNYLKKWMAAALALLLTLSLAACGGMSTGSRTDGIFYDATGVSPDAVLLRVDGVDVTAERYFYWLFSSVSNATAYCGTDGFDTDAGDGRSYGEVCLDFTLEAAKQYAVVEGWAKEQGLALTEEELAEITAQVDSYAEQYGDFGFQYMGVTRETMAYLYQQYSVYEKLAAAVLDEDGALAPTEEELTAYAEGSGLMMADHILLSTKNLSTGEALDDAAVKAQYEKAEEILHELREAEDLPSCFKLLADEYSEDPGRAVYPDGYVFGEGEMLQEFEDAAKSLAVGEISGIVETSAGYHILLRKDIPASELLTEEGYFTYLLEQKAESAKVEYSDLYNEKVLTLDLGAFYTSISEAREALYADYEASLAADENGDATDGEGGDNAGASGSDDAADNGGAADATDGEARG